MEPSQEAVQNILKVLTPEQLTLLVESLFNVRKSGGYGSVSIEMRNGIIKFVTTEVRREA